MESVSLMVLALGEEEERYSASASALCSRWSPPGHVMPSLVLLIWIFLSCVPFS